MLGTPQDRRKWSVLSGLFLVYMASNGITLHTLPLLYPELIETFGWRASEVTLPATPRAVCPGPAEAPKR